jgi:hypothetical protein
VRRSATPDDYKRYQQARTECTATIKKAKRNYWRDYCSKFNKNTSSKELWDRIRLMTRDSKTSKPYLLISNSGSLLGNDKEKADLLAEMYESVSSDANLSTEFLEHRDNFEKKHKASISESSKDQSNINDVFSRKKLADALESAKDTAPGRDRITASMLRHLPSTAREVLLNLINLSWRSGVLPEEWKHSTVIPVLKPLKIPTEPLSYRPVALTSCLCKIMERIIHSRLSWYLEKNQLLSPTQSGFRKKRGTIDNLVRLEHSIQSALHNEQYTIAVMLDLEKAYDLIWTKGLIYKMHKLGIRGRCLNWTRAFLINRSFQVRMGAQYSTKRFPQNGSPQESVISPLLFIIMVNDLPEVLRVSKSGMYADDIVIWKTHKNLKYLTKAMEEDLKRVSEWYRRWGFKVSAGKTSAVIFTKRFVPPLQSVKVEGMDILIEKEAKILGVIFDKKLTWKKQFDVIAAKCKQVTNILRRLCGVDWGANPKQLLNMGERH